MAGPETKRKLVDAGVSLMRKQGYNATKVDEICATAGVTKGGFFHYFKSKEDIAKAALAHFREVRIQEFQAAPFRKLADPLDRVFGRLDFVKDVLSGSARSSQGCLIGMFTLEMAFANTELRATCLDSLNRTAADLELDLAEAKARHAPQAAFDPKSVALLYVSIWQGSLMFAKGAESSPVLGQNLDLFRQYLKFLFGQAEPIPVQAP